MVRTGTDAGLGWQEHEAQRWLAGRPLPDTGSEPGPRLQEGAGVGPEPP